MSAIRLDWFVVKLVALTAAVLAICSLQVSAWTMASAVVALLAATYGVERTIRSAARGRLARRIDVAARL